MATSTISNLYKQHIKNLSASEMEELINLIQSDLSQKIKTGRRWEEIAGAASYPLAGEDAQQWVSESRREGDLGRQQSQVYR